jgi:hypothetical protein
MRVLPHRPHRRLAAGEELERLDTAPMPPVDGEPGAPPAAAALPSVMPPPHPHPHTQSADCPPVFFAPPFFFLHPRPGFITASGSVCLLRIFGRIQKSLRSRWGLGPCNQSIASGFGAAAIKSGRPAAPFRALARVEAALARRSDHPGFARRLWCVQSRQNNQRQRWRVP